jgi:hydrogenase maturation protein HypF
MRLRIITTGLVQGVGFRPFVFRLAVRRHLGGWVLNSDGAVHIEIEGTAEAVQDFLLALPREKPPLAQIHSIRTEVMPDCGDTVFRIKESALKSPDAPFVAPDTAMCEDCRREIMDSGNRRYRYPFTNCTNCGPRYTIIRAVPYDRGLTTMASFTMCPDCQSEFDNPADRRFHAQPNACPVCGPSYRLLNASGQALPLPDAGDVLLLTRRLIRTGHIVAVKGLGGYHLACDARNEAAVALLRSRKAREEKPLAVMCGSLDTIKVLCSVSPDEEELLTGTVRPIVLLDKGPGYDLAESVAPHNPRIGVMLPYTPVHELLLAPGDIWVMTSGNTSDEPISYQDDDAIFRLKSLADHFLVHNRLIHRRADDSVARIFNGEPYLYRRSRGYTPAPIRLSYPSPPLLACGGELKSTFCLASGHQAFLSAHIGDLENQETYQYYTDSIIHYQQLLSIEPQAVAYDLHPGYFSTRYAQALPLPQIGIQHHHAHIAAIMAEHGLDNPVIGVAFDGTGYGTDGALWGGEFLIADRANFVRAAHCRYLPLPGGSKAIKEPWRIALWILHELFGMELSSVNIPFIRSLPADWPVVVKAAALGLNSPLCSSAGRLFDAAAALLGFYRAIHYEGQAAVELELAAAGQTGKALPYSIVKGSPHQLDFRPAFAALIEQIALGTDRGFLAAGFHATIAAAICDTVRLISSETGIRQVALSGGVFQNLRLLAEVTSGLRDNSFTVYLHRQTPPNDGGLALGQAAVAAARLG